MLQKNRRTSQVKVTLAVSVIPISPLILLVFISYGIDFMKFLLMNDLGNWRPRSKRQYMSIFHRNWCYWFSYRTDLIINGCNRHALWHEDHDGMLIQFGDGTFYSVCAGEHVPKLNNLNFEWKQYTGWEASFLLLFCTNPIFQISMSPHHVLWGIWVAVETAGWLQMCSCCDNICQWINTEIEYNGIIASRT